MRHGLLGGLLASLICAASAQAGVYSTVEARLDKPFRLDEEHFNNFLDSSLIPLRRVGTPEADQPWQQLYALTAGSFDLSKVKPLPKDDPFTVADRLNLGVCLLRMRKYQEAVEVLKIANRQAPDNFLVQSTLGTAYAQLGMWDSASAYLGEGRRFWEQPFDKLSTGQKEFLEKSMLCNEAAFSWYATCEKYQRWLVKLRVRELGKSPLTFAKALQRLDALFPLDQKPGEGEPVRFVAENGKFEPGKIAAAEKAKLPKNAISIVQQLLIWMPEDLRLYWQLGELLNASGDVEAAKIVFNDFFNKYVAMQKSDLGDVVPKAMEPKFLATYPEVGGRLQALKAYTPPPPTIEITNPGPPKVVPPPIIKPPVEDKATLNLDWQTLSVGFAVGLVSGALFVWQLREIRRRRQARRLTKVGRELATSAAAMPPGPQEKSG